MANSTITLAAAITAGAKLAVDTITGLFNGATPPADATAQYAKVGFGTPGNLQGVDASNPLPAVDGAGNALLTDIKDRLPSSLGKKAASASLSVTDAAITASFGSKQTSATGATFGALDALACTEVEIKNTRPTVAGLAAADIEVRRGGSGTTVCVPAGGADSFAVTNASDLQIRRYDQSNTQVTVDYEVRS